MDNKNSQSGENKKQDENVRAFATDPELKSVYLYLVKVVQETLDAAEKDKKSIETIVGKIVDIFEHNPYNELLLYMYTASRDNYVAAHIANNVILSVALASSLGVPKKEVLDIGLVAFCHDFGMIEFIDLVKKNPELAERETKLIQKHPLKSAEIFKSLFSEMVINGILDIHECVNGQGYPQGKPTEEISPLAKIVSICDVFEALTHPRSFRKEFSPYEALKMIIKKKAIIFDAKILKNFLEFMSVYPIGSLVYLNTGETGMVIAGNTGTPTRSVVRIILNGKREVDRSQKTVNLLNDPMLYISGTVKPDEEMEILQVLKPRGDIEI